MINRMTKKARRVFRRAHAEVEYFDGGADSLLLGILRETTCLAASVLTDCGFRLQQGRQELETLLRAQASRAKQPGSACLPPTAWMEALKEMHERGRACLNTADLLLAILRDKESIGVTLLARHGLSVDMLCTAAEAAAAKGDELEGDSMPFQEKKSARAYLADLQSANGKARLRAGMGLLCALMLGESELKADESLPVLIDLLHDPDMMVRQWAAQALGYLGPAARPAVPALQEALKDQADVRAQALTALAKIGVEPGVAEETFAPALNDPSASVRIEAAKALWHATQQAERVLLVLLAGLTDADEMVRSNAAQALAEMGPAAKDAVPALLAAFANDNEMVVFWVVDALRAIGAEARMAVPTLLAALRDSRLHVRLAAPTALAAIVPAAPEAVPALVDLLHDPEAQLRCHAADLLHLCGEAAQPAIAAMREALAERTGLVPLHAGKALWELGHRAEVLPVLIRALASSEKFVAATAAGFLGTLGPAASAAVPALRTALSSPDVGVRVAAAGALWRIEHQADTVIPVLMEALGCEEEFTMVLWSLAELGPAARAALPAIQAAYGDPNAQHQVIREAVAKIDPTFCLDADEPNFISALGGNATANPGEEAGAAHDNELADWTEAIQLDPADAQAYRCRAAVHLELGDADGAIADGAEAIRLEPEDGRAYLTRGKAFLATRAFDQAIADFTELIRLEPENLDAHNQRAIAFKRLGNYERAIADYTEALQLAPDNCGVYRNRSLAWKGLKAFDRAQADLREALRSDPVNANAHNDLAWLLATCPDANIRDGAKAVEYARKACELSGWGKTGLIDTLAAACAEAGQFDEAVRWAQQALARPDRLTAAQIAEYTGHLRLYERRQPFRTS
jgi:HEAT repeat protein